MGRRCGGEKEPVGAINLCANVSEWLAWRGAAQGGGRVAGQGAEERVLNGNVGFRMTTLTSKYLSTPGGLAVFGAGALHVRR